MKKIPESTPPAPDTPPLSAVSFDDRHGSPPRGAPLGAILGVTISLLVALLLGGLTTIQLQRDERRELRFRQASLSESVAPIVKQIEEAADLAEIGRILASERLAEVSLDNSNYTLVLRDAQGRVLASSGPDGGLSPPENAVRASVTVRPRALATGIGTLEAWQDGSELASEMALRRREATIDIGVTVMMVIFVVQLAIYLLVSRPFRRLLTAIDKFEQGYPAGFQCGFISRELSWLEWRLHRMSVALTQSARLLVHAHRRATEASRIGRSEDINPLSFDPLTTDHADPASGNEIVRRYLSNRCTLLENCVPGDPAFRSVALEAWQRDAPEAERLGESDLRARLENSALAVLDPDASDRVRRDLEALVASRATWCAATAKAIASALAAENLPHVEIQHRAKNAAGVWRKMQEKHLSIEEVHDLLAFRIIVPGTDHCYLALDIIHRLFDPEPFRFKDYITNPKANGYRSLHTSVRDHDDFVFEVQIRSVDMHRSAEEGNAAHWRYRADKRSVSSTIENIGSRRLLRWLRTESQHSSSSFR